MQFLWQEESDCVCNCTPPGTSILASTWYAREHKTVTNSVSWWQKWEEARGLVFLVALPWKSSGSSTYLCFHFVIPEAEVLQIGSCVGLHRRELVLQHVNDLGQLRISPRKLPSSDSTERRHYSHRMATHWVKVLEHLKGFPIISVLFWSKRARRKTR